MDPILATIDEALKKKGLSDAAASKLAVGHPSLIKNFRMERAGEKRYNLSSLQKLADALDLEFYFGPPRPRVAETVAVEVDGEDFASIKRVEAEASAGPGALNGEPAVIGTLAFRREWLRKLGVKPERSLLVSVTGDSMKPSIHPGDLVLLDLDRTTIQNGQPYIFNDADGETRLKRVHRLGRRTLALISDNTDYLPELREGVDAERVKIVGQVMWSGHTWT